MEADDLPVDLMTGLQTRSFEIELEVRSDGDGRTIVGRVVPFGVVATIPGSRDRERFLPGAFARQIGSGQVGQVKLWSSHQDRLSRGEQKHIGRTVRLEERADGLHGEWQVLRTPKGDEALEMAREGELRGLSVGFVPSKGGTRRAADGVLERSAAHADHVALTPTPAYVGAEVLAVRTEYRPLGAYQEDLARLRALNRPC